MLLLLLKVDDRNNIRPGAKYFEWERKGVPLRIEIGTVVVVVVVVVDVVTVAVVIVVIIIVFINC